MNPLSRAGSAIILFGLDGSGKTTQAKLLLDHARKNNIRAVYIWLRLPWRISLPLLVLNRLCKVTRRVTSDDGTQYVKTELWKSPRLSYLWRIWIPLAFRIVSRIKIHDRLKKGYMVVIDRYIFDAIVDFAIDTDDDASVSRIWTSFTSVLPKPRQVFYLDIPAESAKGRKPGEDLGILQRRRMLYKAIAKKYGAISIDATNSAEDVHRRILKACNLV